MIPARLHGNRRPARSLRDRRALARFAFRQAHARPRHARDEGWLPGIIAGAAAWLALVVAFYG